MKSTYYVLIALLVLSCSQKEPNFSVSCDTLMRTKVMQVIHLDFNFKENTVVERKVPTESGLLFDNAMIQRGNTPTFNETTREYKIIDVSPTLIKFGNPKSNNFEIVFSLDRTSLQYTTTVTMYNLDNTIAEPLMEGMPNPSVDTKKCRKPRI